MRNKTIKILISIIILIGIALIANVSNATYNGTTYTPDGFYPQQEGNVIWFCGEKGVTLRLANQVTLKQALVNAGVITSDKYPSNSFGIEYFKVVEEHDNVGSIGISTLMDGFKIHVQSKVRSMLSNITDNELIYDITGENSTYNNDSSSTSKPADSVNDGSSFLLMHTTTDRHEGERPNTTTYKESDKLAVYKSVTIAAKPTYNVTQAAQTTQTNNMHAYILSSIKDWDPPVTNKQNYITQDYLGAAGSYERKKRIQYAVWLDHGVLNKGYALTQANKNAGGQNYVYGEKLFNESKEYENFYNANIKNGYNASISLANDNPIIVINRNDGTYTAGPYIANYPDDGRFSFMSDLYVTDQNGNRINVTAITSDGRTYPSSGTEFYIKFSYASNPSDVKIHASFAYLNNVTATYKRLENTYGEKYTYYAEVYAGAKTTQSSYDYAYVKYLVWADTFYYREVEYYKAQTPIMLIGTNRTWGTASASQSTKLAIKIKLEGYVFVDEPAGKESEVDGIFDGSKEKYVPNVPVYLYRVSDNSQIASTKTDENGFYSFNNLNAIDRYYVRFVYNGQYYEPTWYTTPSNTPAATYQSTSNGTEFNNTRTAFNNKFAEIGSSPNNYGTNKKTYTRKELLGYTYNDKGEEVKTKTAVIDEFGNLILESSSDADLQSKINFVKDCRIDSWTKPAGNTANYDKYPIDNITMISCSGGSSDRTMKHPLAGVYSWNDLNSLAHNSSSSQQDKSLFINQGLKYRQEMDLAVKKDVQKITLTINDNKIEYKYGNRNKFSNMSDELKDDKYEVSVRLSDAYYDQKYTREIYQSDYIYKVSSYGSEATVLGKTKDKELEIYITYKILVVNRSQSIRTSVTELVDYYDPDLKFLDNAEDSYFRVFSGGKYSEKRAINASTESIYSNSKTNIDGYDRMYISTIGKNSDNSDLILNAGDMIELILTYQVKKDTVNGEDWLRIDEDINTGVIAYGKENIVEINGYKTWYREGTVIPNITETNKNAKNKKGTTGKVVAGILDVNSNPGNLDPKDVTKDMDKNAKNLENDTDFAPPVQIIFTEDKSGRVLSGYVWEDERTKTVGYSTSGDGVRQENETKINGVNVELVEICKDGTEFVWRKYSTNGTGSLEKVTPIINMAGKVQDYAFEGDRTGTYAFCSYIPGNYIVRFTYGDSYNTVLTNLNSSVNGVLNKKGMNEKSYNGQDYQSTIYQEGLNTYENSKNLTKTYTYDIAAGDTKLVSDAKDLWNVRQNIVNYSYNNDSTSAEKKNAFAELLASPNELPTYNGRSYTKDQMFNLIDQLMNNTKVTAETGIFNMKIEYNTEEDPENAFGNTREYHLQNLDLGLQERPKAQIDVDKKITRAKITLANGTILVDAIRDDQNPQQKIDNVIWNYHSPYLSGYKYGTGLMDPEKYGNIENIRTVNAMKYGLFNIVMDEELMHGATVTIYYEITARNVGEIDYKDEQFFYTGIASNNATVVTTTAHEVVDYVPNNLQYYAESNKDYWNVVSKDTLVSYGLVNSNLVNNLKEYETIISSTSIDKPLVPTIYKENFAPDKDSSVSIPLVLTQIITPENETKDLTYRNIVEIVRTTNLNGRRNNYSVVGNQDPLLDPAELDSDKDTLIILVPFGNGGLPYIIATVVALVTGIAIAGVLFIKKKVIRK